MDNASIARALLAFERGIGRLAQAVIVLSTAGIFVVLLAGVALRYLGRGNLLTWASELPELLFPWLVMAGVVLAATRGAHLSIVFLTSRLHGARATAALTLRTAVVLGVYGWLFLRGMEILPIVADERTAILQVSNAWTYGCVLAGMALLALVETMLWARHLLSAARDYPTGSLAAEAS